MKLIKRAFVITLSLVLTVTLAACASEEKVIEDVPVLGPDEVCDFNGLMQLSDIIVKVKITDTLNEENSYETHELETGTFYMPYGVRKGKVLEYYKDSTGAFAEELDVVEMAAILDNKYYHSDVYETLKEGNEYILFLSDVNDGEAMRIMAGNSGVVRFDPAETSLNSPDVEKGALALEPIDS